MSILCDGWIYKQVGAMTIQTNNNYWGSHKTLSWICIELTTRCTIYDSNGNTVKRISWLPANNIFIGVVVKILPPYIVQRVVSY